MRHWSLCIFAEPGDRIRCVRFRLVRHGIQANPHSLANYSEITEAINTYDRKTDGSLAATLRKCKCHSDTVKQQCFAGAQRVQLLHSQCSYCVKIALHCIIL